MRKPITKFTLEDLQMKLKLLEEILEKFMDRVLAISGSTDDVEIVEKENEKLLTQTQQEIEKLLLSKEKTEKIIRNSILWDLQTCKLCGAELRMTNEIDKCNKCQSKLRVEYPFLEPTPSALIGLKCPHCQKEISLVVYKSEIASRKEIL